MSARFLQIHTLTSYPASLLNRDDAGLAKRMPFGGAERTRISSQCLKRHWRHSDGPHRLDAIDKAQMSVRSRITFEDKVVGPLVAEGLDESRIRAAVDELMSLVFGKSAKAKAKAKKGEETPAKAETGQVTVLGPPEIDYLRTLARAVAQDEAPIKAAIKTHLGEKDLKKNLQALKHAAGLDAALFGRMVTSDVLAQSDAAVHVAHALTVHANAAEPDYFSVVDDLVKEAGEAGSGHVNTAELTAGVFYSYVVVDVGQLVANLADDREMAGEVVRRLVHLMATESPGAKKGSTAPYARSHLVLVEAGDEQPRTLANAFLRPVPSRGVDVIERAYAALATHVADLDQMYGTTDTRRLAAMGPTDALSKALPTPGALTEAADWLAAQVKG